MSKTAGPQTSRYDGPQGLKEEVALKLGISAFAWTAAFQARHLDLMSGLRDQGFAALEIPMFHPADLDTRSIRQSLVENGLEGSVCCILPAGINPISPDPDTRKRSVKHLQSCIEATAAMGSHLMAGPVYGPIGYQPGHRPDSDELQWFLDALQAIEPHLNSHDVALAFEPVNRSETHFLRTAEQALGVCREVPNPRIGVTIDTFHANIEEKNTPEALTSLGSHLKHIHLSENDRGIVCGGHINFVAILQALKGISYDGYLMIEGFGYSPKEPTAPGFLWADREIAPEVFAQASLANLQKLLTDA